MRTKSILSMIAMTAVVITVGLNVAHAGFPAPPGFPMPPGLPGASVNVRIDGYLPAPPGVQVQIDSGRPYYVERNQRVYMEKKHHGKHYKKEKKHHDNRDHDKHEKHGKHGH